MKNGDLSTPVCLKHKIW